METLFTIYYRSNPGNNHFYPSITTTLAYHPEVATAQHVNYINSHLVHIREYGAVGGEVGGSRMTYIPPDSIISVEISGYLPENFFPGPLRS